MKAYQIMNIIGGSDSYAVVFAENANKAKAMGVELFVYEYYYTDFRVRRLPLLDRFYNGEKEIDYYNTEVRNILCEKYGWIYE